MATSDEELRSALELDLAAETQKIAGFLKASLRTLKRRGLVVAVSGGIDSATCAALAVNAVGKERVFGLLLPEQDSSDASSDLGQELVDQFGIQSLRVDLRDTLAAIGCYEARDEAIRQVVPAYGPGWKNKIVLTGGAEGAINRFLLTTKDPAGHTQTTPLPLNAYLQIVAATNYKQRIRKTIEYYHADRLNYAVVGTPNLLEYDQGFFVKNGDGSADVKPIAHLYKTQVYAMARHLGVPASICNSAPTTDTYSLPQSQEEFYFALPHDQMDLALWAFRNDTPAETLARALNLSPEQAEWVYRDIQQKQRTAAYLHAEAMKVE